MALGTPLPSIIFPNKPHLKVNSSRREYVSTNLGVKSIFLKFRTQEDPIIDLESIGQPLGQVLAHGSFAMLHFRDMGLADPYEHQPRGLGDVQAIVTGP